MDIHINKISSASEVETVAALAKTIWNEYYKSLLGQAQVDYMLGKYQTQKAINAQIKDGDYDYFLILADERPVGYFGIIEKHNEVFLSKLYILGSERGKRIGRIAINFLMARCREIKAEYITLTVNKHNLDSISAYEKMGFEIYGELVSDIGSGYVMDDFQMRLRINPR